MPPKPEESFPAELKDVAIIGFAVGARISSWMMSRLLATSTGFFVVEGMIGNTEEMNQAGMGMYAFGVGTLATRWAVNSPHSPINAAKASAIIQHRYLD